MRKILLISLMGLFSSSAYAVQSGFVTPAELTVTFAGVSLLTVDGGYTSILSTESSVKFKASDSDLQASSMGTATFPEGRYIGISISMYRARDIKLEGYKYQGASGTGLNDGEYLCTTGSATDGTGLVKSTSSTCSSTPTTLKLTDNLTSARTEKAAPYTFFPKVYCIATSSSKCQSTDQFIDSTVSSNLTIYLILDLYNLVKIDNSGASPTVNYIEANVMATLGKPGAAFHLSSTASGSPRAEATLIFDNSKRLVYASNDTVGGTTAVAGFCGGRMGATVTAVPSGEYLSPFGYNLVNSLLTSTSSGALAYAVANTFGVSGNIYNITPTGIQVFSGLLAPAGSSVTANCYADSSSSLTTAGFSPYLGYTYKNAAGAGNSSNPGTLQVKKVADPSGLFSISTCNATSTSGCGSYPK